MRYNMNFHGRWKRTGRQTRSLRAWRLTAIGILVLGSLTAGFSSASAQTPAEERSVPAPSPKPPDFSLPPVDLKSLPRNLLMDQKNLWLTPFHMTTADLHWLVPLGIAGAALVASDTAIEKHVPTNPTTVSHAVTASNLGLGAFAAVGGGMFLLGHITDNDQERETGVLSGEAALDAFIDTEALSYALGRERPFSGDGRGRFFQGGDSFPSEHSAISFAIASVIAHEYPGIMTEILAYGAAGGVSAARFAGQKHFASDLAVGAALRVVFRARGFPLPLSLQRCRYRQMGDIQ